MRAALHEVWGSGRGPLSRITPQARIIAGAAVFGACAMAPVSSHLGQALVASLPILWIAACKTPVRVVVTVVLGGAALFLPYFLLTPLIAGPTGTWLSATRVPAGIAAHGMAGMLITVGTASVLPTGELRDGLMGLPLPRLVSAILLQIVHQTATLTYETRRIAAAMSVRGASGGGTAALRVLVSLPRVWLPRVLVRAERVADAMELRGYADEGELFVESPAYGVWDRVILVLAAGALVLGAAARYGDAVR